MLHTILNPADVLLPQQAYTPQYLNIKGGLVEYSETDGEKQVSRLVSTNPYMYLDPKLQPYSKIQSANGRQI